ncbi:MAG: TonB-dependent receptor plug domain-containing protein [Chitinophagaceae bacterium]
MTHFTRYSALLFFTCFCTVLTYAQTTGDTSKSLPQVTIQAFGQNRQLKEVSGAINIISANELERFSNTSLLPAVNTTPGVRMEERSPGSYRLNVRGTSLRSPFGVRNVKVYWNGIPFTDPGGNTYLNQLGFSNVHSLEIIKGPAGSLYGAGTGGVVLLNSLPDNRPAGVDVGYQYGSFQQHNINAQVRTGNEEHRDVFSYSHLQSDGYREHTSMRRDVATWETHIKTSEKQQLSASVLYGNLYYQTPGALTKAEYASNPKAARPAAGAFPSADGAKAAIYQQTFLAGITHDYRFSDAFRNQTVVYGAFSLVKNPTFRNYEKRTEPHFGGRTVFTWERNLERNNLQVLLGGEAQQGYFNTKTYQNKNGNPDTLQTDDDINNRIISGFVQADLQLFFGLAVNAGVSINQSAITITRLSVPSFVPVKKTYNSEWAPRLAISQKVLKNTLLYVSVAKGFSPPATQEILPSTSVISTGLQAEHGVNYEAGIKSNLLQQRLYIEVNAFWYQLKNAIVQRRDASNADYFINAGSTRQRGIESQASYQLLNSSKGFFTSACIRSAYTYYHFRYHDFKQIANDFSGKKLPGAATNTFSAGIDAATRPGLYTNITWFYSDPVALNDANTDIASSYNLLGGRIGWRKTCKKIMLDIFAGADNLFNVTYSLGNDINATGGRYYNTAPGANYFAGVIIQSRF